MTEKALNRFPLIVRSSTGLALLLMAATLFTPVSKEVARVLYVLFRISVLMVLAPVLAEIISWRKDRWSRTLIDSLCCVLLLLVWFFTKASSY